MDETTLTRTLQELAANPPLHPAPSADARRRSSRLRRNRRTGAATIVVAVVLGAVGLVQLPSGSSRSASPDGATSWQHQLEDPRFPNHATTDTVVVMDTQTGVLLTVAYWQGEHLCAAKVSTGRVGGSTCASSSPSPSAALSLQLFGGFAGPEVWASVRPDVTSVKATRPDGSSVVLQPLSADGFPYRVVATTGRVMSLRALGRDGKQVGTTVAGPDAAQLRPVLAVFDCKDSSPTGFDVTLPTEAEPAKCYGLAPAAMTFVPKTAAALYDSTQGWLVAIALDDHDQVAFGRLTQRITSQNAPKNQLAIVLDGKVVSAPTIQEAILGGQLQITGGEHGFTKDQAQDLAGQMGA